MTFLRNAWYPAAWSAALGDAPMELTMLDQFIVLFRGEGGQPKALHDACPHRFAPLSRGKSRNGRIVCGYHGLEFDGAGRCVHNPHGHGATVSALRVRAFPVAERYGMLWIWMGAEGGEESHPLPDLPLFDDPGLTWVHGQLDVRVHYELVTDNLLDLTHVEFLHPFLASPGNAARTHYRCEQMGDEVRSVYTIREEPVTGLFQLLWPDAPERANMVADIVWQAPARLSLKTSMGRGESAAGDDPQLVVMHLLVPQGENATRYFWAAGRNSAKDSEQVSAMLHQGTQNAFEFEDEPMIAAVRSRMRSNDLMAHKPAILPFDEGAIRARRILARMLGRELAEQATG
ncbi:MULTISPECIES: aromatic ring-hydroxylating dioxygenase subunit alpha [unclassified Novosphingobium]|uniref:aromatic ring-hydroxylating dioxygenase subunit alpha n=1 Tax=unclassified Novosphingobium TaxID=2644732 RepID=UPI000868AE3C|nr:MULTISPECIES: aromatic ring-hydroxylating dioxygenase subunit alpha [unclassified Novosphingobium]ODU83347.1 MAG: hypothetical protein ABT10_07020 [Novosphingobium sp. SCN 63-17]OJX96384.1 MAG: hypothetical protein BGP00_17605 [Novosphingobium sp. 63-713]